MAHTSEVCTSYDLDMKSCNMVLVDDYINLSRENMFANSFDYAVIWLDKQMHIHSTENW